MIERRLGPARVVWTDRLGGVSAPPYDEANLGAAVGDRPTAVAENRRTLAARLGLPAEGWAWLHQVHGDVVVVADASWSGDAPAADAAVTASAGLPLVVQTADCAPIALACDDAIAVVHAGWPGLVAGVIPRAVERLREVGRGRVRAALGPCIHPCCYEFGRDDLDRVAAVLGGSIEARTRDGGLALDIPKAVRRALELVDVVELDDVDVCTFTSPEHFSHRRDGTTGRQALVAVIDA